MVMISPCAGCITPEYAPIFAIFEALSGIVTIIKSAWWYWFFRIPVKKKRHISQQISENDGVDDENPEIEGGESLALSILSVVVVGSDSTTIQPPPPLLPPENDDNDSRESDSISSFVSDANANNVLWTITGMVMGTINIAFALFLLLGLVNVNYVFLASWCLSFPLFYLLDCALFTFLLKHCTSKIRFEKLIFWCHCRRDPYLCRFQRDYCHSFNLNFSRTVTHQVGRKDFGYFYELNEIYHPVETLSFKTNHFAKEMLLLSNMLSIVKLYLLCGLVPKIVKL